MTLYLPEHVAVQERRKFAAEVARRVYMDQRCDEFTDRLQREIDPYLVMVKAHDLIAPGTPLRPGFYHVLRHNENAPLTVIPITEHDEYVEPDARVFIKLTAGRMTERRVMDAIHAQDAKQERDEQRENERAKEERRAELRDRANAVTRAQVSMDRSIPWTQSSNGRRPR